MKKKTLAVLLAAALGASMLWGCGKGNDAGASAPPPGFHNSGEH